MAHDISPAEAGLALEAVQRRQQDVLNEIDVPRWYWPGMAAGWVVLGLQADFAPGWASSLATVAFGAAHATIAQRVLSGRKATGHLSISRDLVSRRVPAVIIGFLVAMVLLTIGAALVLDADGARPPAALAGVVVALVVLASGPHVMGAVRRQARRAASR